MDDSRFFLMAIKVGEHCLRGRRVLKDTQPYYFCEGYTISDDGKTIAVNETKVMGDEVFNDYLQEVAGEDCHVPQVSIHAIVGKNGSGKSTLVEMMIRLLNNFAAILFGEQITDSYTSHLHYIDGIEGELYYMLGDEPYRLSICGRAVGLDRYERRQNPITKRSDMYEMVEDKHLGDISVEDMKPILEDLDGGSGDAIRHYIEAFFYTIVSNYSIYAYNTLDYSDENVEEPYERKILAEKFGEEKAKKMKVTASERNWLHGLFHKNDGYKTPLVLTPFRDEGKININVENTLSRERFISLLLMSNEESGRGFRRINGHLDVDGFSIGEKGDYGREYINANVDMDDISQQKYDVLVIYILGRWSELLFDNSSKLEEYASKKKYGQTALNYLLYKTIKITTKYHDYLQYNDDLTEFLEDMTGEKDDDFLTELNGYLEALLEDRSHITRKIRQTLAYILTPAEEDEYDKAEGRIDVAPLAENARRMVKYFEKRYNYDFYVRGIEDMIPPPFLDVKIQMREVTGDGKEMIPFETLSSGEKQQVYSVSSILYHLMNINSVEEDKSGKRFCYHYVNIVLEEIELYFHPDFQKQYITLILDGLAQVNLNNIYGLNICFVTHSPFVLSDIPKGNLLALEDGKSKGRERLKTFGANIYDMLKESFFIKGSPIGGYAQWVITRIIVALRVWQIYNEHPDINGEVLMKMVASPKIESCRLDFMREYTERERWEKGGKDAFEREYSGHKLKRMIDKIDEPLIHSSLMKEYYMAFPEAYDKAQEIAMLEHRLAELREN